MKKIAVVGCGYVGLSLSLTLSTDKNNKINCIDIDKNKIDMLKNGLTPIYDKGLEKNLKKYYKNINFSTKIEKDNIGNTDIIFITVGTPESQDGSTDLTYLWQVCKEIKQKIIRKCFVVIKSTVPIGTSDEIQEYLGSSATVIFNPEFLSQGTAMHDILFPKRIIIGCDNDNAFTYLKNLCSKVIKNKNIPIIKTTRRNAEMIKYASNSFLATKISFMNELSNLCKKLDVDICDVAKGMGYDERIGSEFLNAGIGYGGSCLPKDTISLLDIAKKNDIDLKIVSACIEANNQQKYVLYNKFVEIMEHHQIKKIGILGVTFKPNTDDLRNSPAVDNIKQLLKLNLDIYVYDPKGLKNLEKIFSNKIVYCDSIDETISNADAVFIFTEWNEIKFYKCNNYHLLMRYPIIFDGRNCYNPIEIREKGIDYICIGR